MENNVRTTIFNFRFTPLKYTPRSFLYNFAYLNIEQCSTTNNSSSAWVTRIIADLALLLHILVHTTLLRFFPKVAAYSLLNLKNIYI